MKATTRDELVEVLRCRMAELNQSCESVEHIGGLQSGYASKLLSDPPIKNLGEMSLAALLGALALRIARVELVEDPEQLARVLDRLKPRHMRGGAVLQARRRARKSDASQS